MIRKSNADRRRSNQCGFTLLEVILSLALLAVSVGGLYAMLESGLSRSSRDEQRLYGLEVAQSTLADVLATQEFENRSGENAGYRWSVEFSDGADPGGSQRWRLLDIQVRVSWGARGGEETVIFRTQRIVAATTRTGL